MDCDSTSVLQNTMGLSGCSSMTHHASTAVEAGAVATTQERGTPGSVHTHAKLHQLSQTTLSSDIS